MKRIVLCITISIICALSSFAQKELFQHQLNVIRNAFNSKDVALLDSLLSEDCTVLGNSGKLLLPSIKAVFGTLADNTIEGMTLVNLESTENGDAILTYKIKYSVLGEKDACFAFDGDGKITQLDYIVSAKAQTVKNISAHKAASPLVSIPFNVDSNHLIIIKGTINGKDCNLIWDSGAKRSILNSDYLTDLKTKQGSANIGGVNAQTTSGMATAGSINLNVSGITTENATFITRSLKHLESNGAEMPIAGLIGTDMFGGYDIIYDYDTRKLTLIDSHAQIRLQGNPILTVPYSQFASDYLPCIKVNMGGKEVELGIDCGAGANLIQENALPNDVNFETSTLTGISGNTTEQKLGDIDFTIGDVSFAKQPFVVGDISHLNLGIDGLLGYPFLSSHKMMFKNSTRELIIF